MRRVCRHWLRRTYAPQKHEWAYRSIPRRILVEELLLGPDGKLPEDIKFHMYDGVCRPCTVETGRDGELLACHYTPEWQLYDRANETAARDGKLAPERPRPVRLDAMRAVAERLSAGLDYLRVDFLDLGERFTMTELRFTRRAAPAGRSTSATSRWGSTGGTRGGPPRRLPGEASRATGRACDRPTKVAVAIASLAKQFIRNARIAERTSVPGRV